jgi:CarD family transcriptional regulator, regulator of rRNA transcription
MFKVGESLVYPTQGLAVVEAIETKEIMGSPSKFYVLRMINRNMSVLVPTDNAEKIGLRPIIVRSEVDKVLEVLSSDPVEHKSSYWHHRYNDNYQKLKSGCIFQTAEVIRDLNSLRERKKLAVKETRMIDNAKQLLVNEIAYARRIEVEDAQGLVDVALTHLHQPV